MKVLDILIVILIVLVLASGGFLVYSIVSNPESDSGDSNATPTPVAQCIDLDSDTFGEGCAAGPDCDDADDGRAAECKVIENAINLTTDKTSYAVGEQVKVTVNIAGVPQDANVDAEALELRLDYDTTSLKYVSNLPIPEYSPAIDLETETRIEIDMVNIEGIAVGDKPITITFEAVKAGTAMVSVGEDTRMEIVYAVVGGEVQTTIM